jgi:hypothetical protein
MVRGLFRLIFYRSVVVVLIADRRADSLPMGQSLSQHALAAGLRELIRRSVSVLVCLSASRPRSVGSR